jgi:hypothetical protein
LWRCPISSIQTLNTFSISSMMLLHVQVIFLRLTSLQFWTNVFIFFDWLTIVATVEYGNTVFESLHFVSRHFQLDLLCLIMSLNLSPFVYLTFGFARRHTLKLIKY